MLKKRLIPVLLLKNGLLVRSESFEFHQIIGDPIHEVKRFNEWNVDELVYLDISKDDQYDSIRGDHKTKGLDSPLKIIQAVSKSCFVPLTWGGRIRTMADVRLRLSNGADKVVICTAAYESPDLIEDAAKAYGSQAVVVCIDFKRIGGNSPRVSIHGASKDISITPWDWAKQLENMGAGEIFLQAVDRDGTGEGYDLDMISKVSSSVKIPVIACGGVGQYEHYVDGINAGASAVASANIWHFKEMADRGGKQALMRGGVDIRS